MVGDRFSKEQNDHDVALQQLYERYNLIMPVSQETNMGNGELSDGNADDDSNIDEERARMAGVKARLSKSVFGGSDHRLYSNVSLFS